MKYSEIIGLQEYFHPVFNLQDEAAGYWKQFIPTTQFNDILQTVIDAIRSADPKKRLSFWVQGTFGTGKSHAGAVVKHLLCDDVNDITEYLDENLSAYPQLLASIKRLRGEKRFFPVVLKGSEGIYNSRTFTLKLEKAVKAALAQAGISVTVNSQFERYCEHIENKRAINWDEVIKNDEYLSVCVHNKQDILNKLRAYDVDFLSELEDALNKQDIDVLSNDDKSLTKWLIEINKELSTKGLDGIIIFWDEFTSIMDSISSGLTNQLQNIAELSEKQNIFLYLISHRTPANYNDTSDDVTKMKDRFHLMSYKMETMTTYHIMSATIKKLDAKKYDSFCSEKKLALDTLITRLVNNDSSQAKSDIVKLFPLHPYTAYLSTFVARNIGSANRSVFNFLYDEERGFANFIANNEIESGYLLTPDRLWDFFLDTFESDNAKYGIIVEKYMHEGDRVKAKGENYTKVFKGILLLNAMNNILSKDLSSSSSNHNVVPSADNVKDLFIGEAFESDVDDILTYIDSNEIVTRDPLGNFLIEFSALPSNEISQQVKDQKLQYKKSTDVLSFSKKGKDAVVGLVSGNTLREAEVVLFECGEMSEDVLRSRLAGKAFTLSYATHVAMFLAMDEAELIGAQQTIKKLAIDPVCKDVVFVLVNEPLGSERYNKFIDYRARASVADKHQLREQSQSHAENAERVIVNDWVLKIKTNYSNVFFRSTEPTQTSSALIYKVINDNVAPKIFHSGIDSSALIRRSAVPAWKTQNSKTATEGMLFGRNRDDVEERLDKQYKYARFILKDPNDSYLVDEDMHIKEDADDNNFLVKFQNQVDSILEAAQQRVSSVFNIGDELEVLTRPPYGVYTNILNMALMGFALRKYENVLYHAELGQPLTVDNIRDLILDMFDYWQKNAKNENKLKVRFGSKEEKALKDKIVEIFNLHDIPGTHSLSSLTDVKFVIKGDFVKHKAKYPIWSLLYASKVPEDCKEQIKMLISLIDSTESKIEDITRTLKHIKDNVLKLTLYCGKAEHYKEGFMNYLLKIDNTNEAFNKMDDVFEYLKSSLQTEIGYWKESEVEAKVYKWMLASKQQPTPAPANVLQDHPVSGYGPKPTWSTTGMSAFDIVKKNAKERVKNSGAGEQKLKEVLMSLIDQFPDIITVIESEL